MLLLFGAVVFISGTDPKKLKDFTATGFSVYVDGSNICESITEEDFLQELENPTF